MRLYPQAFESGGTGCEISVLIRNLLHWADRWKPCHSSAINSSVKLVLVSYEQIFPTRPNPQICISQGVEVHAASRQGKERSGSTGQYLAKQVGANSASRDNRFLTGYCSPQPGEAVSRLGLTSNHFDWRYGIPAYMLLA